MSEATDNKTLKVSLGAVSGAFILAAIFWAGAAYNRINGIEQQLIVIGQRLEKLADINLIQERSLRNEKRIERLEERFMELQK